jgi:DNA-binding transcriptional LysR family regulator
VGQIQMPNGSNKTNPLQLDRLGRTLYSHGLVYFAAVAETGSIRAAAQKLNVAASAVNRQLIQLEGSIGIQLFDRVGRGLRISPAGEILSHHYSRLTRDLDGTLSEIRELQGLRIGHVRIATVESFAGSILPRLISAFTGQYPLLQVSIFVLSSTDVQDAVSADEADIGMAFNPLHAERFNIEIKHDLTIGAVVRGDHPLAKRKKVLMRDCLEFPTVLPARGLSLRDALDPLLRRQRERTRQIVETTSLRFMTELVLAGDFVSFQTQIGIIPRLSTGEVVFLALDDAGLRADQFTVITNVKSKLQLAPSAFLAHCQKEIGSRL